MDIFSYFKTVLVVQLFYSISMTMLVYALSTTGMVSNIGLFTDAATTDIQSVGEDIESNFSNQLNVPLIDLGSLVFFSGNIIADLILNFVTAVPSMITMLWAALFLFVPIDSVLQSNIKLFTWVIITIIYLLGTMQFLANVRTGGRIV